MSLGRILLAEDEDQSRRLLERGLARLGWEVCGVADGQAALDRLDVAWDVVVTDIRMPRVDGLALLPQLAERCPSARRIVITSFGDKKSVIQALNHGAHYLLEKPFTAQQLSEVIQRQLRDRDDGAQIDQLFRRRLASLPLQPRECEVVVLVLKGCSNRDIGAMLGVSEQRVKNQLLAIYHKLGVSSRGGLFHCVFPV